MKRLVVNNMHNELCFIFIGECTRKLTFQCHKDFVVILVFKFNFIDRLQPTLECIGGIFVAVRIVSLKNVQAMRHKSLGARAITR